MSFSLYLMALKNNELDYPVREQVAFALAANKDTISYDDGRFIYTHTDKGQAELRLAEDAMVSGINVSVTNLSLGLVEYLFELLEQWSLLLVDSQGTGEAEHPTIFALSEDYFQQLPDDFTSPRCVIERADILHTYLSGSFCAWLKYRDQIVGEQSVIRDKLSNPINANFNHADIRFLFDLIATPFDLEMRHSLWQQVEKKIDTNAVDDVFHDVFSSLDAKKQWVWIQVDVRDSNEVRWQAAAIAKTLALPDEYMGVEEEHVVSSDTFNSLLHFDEWLSQFEKSFILIDGGDTYFGFVTSDSDVESAIDKLQSVGVDGQAIRHITFNKAMVVKQAIETAKENADQLGLLRSSGFESYPVLDDVSMQHEVMVFKLAPSNDALKTLVVEYSQTALAAGRVPLICLSASWCEPCQEMLIALHHKDAQSVMKQLVLILIEIDDWGVELENINIYPTCVPIFFDVLEDGSAGQKSVDGDAWDDAIPSVVAGVLRDTFQLI